MYVTEELLFASLEAGDPWVISAVAAERVEFQACYPRLLDGLKREVVVTFALPRDGEPLTVHQLHLDSPWGERWTEDARPNFNLSPGDSLQVTWMLV